MMGTLLSVVVITIGGMAFVWFCFQILGLDGPREPWDPPV